MKKRKADALAPAATTKPELESGAKAKRKQRAEGAPLAGIALGEGGGASKAAKARAGSAELDDIFGALGAKRKAAAAAVAEAAAAAACAAAARGGGGIAGGGGKKKKMKGEPGGSSREIDPVFGEDYDLDRAIDPQNAKVHRHDAASGLRVFKAHDLGLGRGGGTPLCPFDCKCCF